MGRHTLKPQELPQEALAATIVGYGGHQTYPLNGCVVELAGYLEDMGLFEGQLTESVMDGRTQYRVGDIVLCKPGELKPLTAAAEAYIAGAALPKPDEFEARDHRLCDLLASVGVQVPILEVCKWTVEQRVRIEAYARIALDSKAPKPPKPEELP